MRLMDSEFSLLDFERALRGERIFVTGHSGFTGGWLVSWLKCIGCDVAGLALQPSTEPNLFTVAHIADGIDSTIGDIRDPASVRAAIERHQPSIIIHLAAQPLVSQSFADPIETFATNAMGTAMCWKRRDLRRRQGCRLHHHRQGLPRPGLGLGLSRTGSAGRQGSLQCLESLCRAGRSLLPRDAAARGNGVLIANARGGNIIGGGDWSADRSCLTSFAP